jgi:alpha-glucoside transport system permease protein
VSLVGDDVRVGRSIPEVAVRPSGRRVARALRRSLVHVIVAGVCVIWGVPLVGFVVTSFRPTGAAATTGWWDAFGQNEWTLANFRVAFAAGLGHAGLNSLLITVPANIALVTFAAVVAYVLTQMAFVGRAVTLVVILAFLTMPPQVTLEPTFKLFAALHLVGQIPSVWIFQAGFTMPLGIFILVAFFHLIPHELVEAARIDGASEVRILLRIFGPLALPGLLCVLILHFIFSWNDLLIPLLFLNSQAAPLTVQVAGIAQQTNADTQATVAAAALLSVLPPVALFYGLQRYFVRGLTAGATKG